MRVSSRLRHAAMVAALLGLAGSVSVASAAPTDSRSKTDISPILVRGEVEKQQHGGDSGHLPARNEGFEFISSLELSGEFGDVTPEVLRATAAKYLVPEKDWTLAVLPKKGK